jgi:hypothetical protein
MAEVGRMVKEWRVDHRRTCVVSKALEMVDATIALFAAYHVNRTATKLTLPLIS